MPTTSATTARDAAWRRSQLNALLSFGEASLRPDGGAQWLDDDGRPDLAQPVHTWITARMAHCYAFASLLGRPGAGELADRALNGLLKTLADPQYGGWFASIGANGTAADAVGRGDLDATKAGYAHAFVVLAGASGTMAGRAGARELLDLALQTLDQHFWEPGARMHADEVSRDWSVVDPYRGVNGNMHSVEALLAAHDATGDAEWLERATSIAERVIGYAAGNEWRIPEHYSTDWLPQLEFNADRPRDQFKPYGSTPGHGLEWSRLIVQLDVAAGRAGGSVGTDLPHLEQARSLYHRAATDGWDRERGGFVYTVDWSGKPVEPRRFHWVAAEAVAAAEMFAEVTCEQRYRDDAQTWWSYIDRYLIDHERGSWFHELDAHNHPSPVTWVGKPDIYHAAQALVLPGLPVTGSVTKSVAEAQA